MTPVANCGQVEPQMPIGNTGLIPLLGLYPLISCVSLVLVQNYYASPLHLTAPDTASVLRAAARIMPFAIVSILFAFARFSFGYVVSFGFYTIIFGYLWLSEFSSFHYNHSLAYVSAFASGLAFFLPAMLVISPIKQRFALPADAFDRLMSFVLILSLAVLAIGADFNVSLLSPADSAEFRNQLEFPVWQQYAMSITSTVLIPFAFAYFAMLRKPWRAGFSLLLLLSFYPITLSKLSLFAPVWLPFLALASRYFSTRVTIILSFALPIFLGIFLAGLHETGRLSYANFIAYFNIINFRMIALTSSALDVYNDFFSSHDLTYFCQVNIVKRLIACPYTEPLATLMRGYGLGNFNASLLATEGIASVGTVFAPISIFACGLVIALGNRVSFGLPSRFVLISSAMFLQVLMNVPLTITMATNGGAVLFLLWYLTPRCLFEPPARNG